MESAGGFRSRWRVRLNFGCGDLSVNLVESMWMPIGHPFHRLLSFFVFFVFFVDNFSSRRRIATKNTKTQENA